MNIKADFSVTCIPSASFRGSQKSLVSSFKYIRISINAISRIVHASLKKMLDALRVT